MAALPDKDTEVSRACAEPSGINAAFSNPYAQLRQIAASWNALLEERTKADMRLRNTGYGAAKLLMKLLAPVLPGARECLRRLRANRDLAKDCLMVKHSGLFDSAWYVDKYPEAAPSRDPVMYYLREGARQGHDPSPAFDTYGYLRANPDVAESGTNPLVHYIRFGIGEGRDSRPSRIFLGIPETPDVDPSALPASLEFGVEPTSAIAVICHVFYGDLWRQELADQIGHINRPFDLFVTITEQETASIIADAVREKYPTAHVKVVPNHGRDIYPFVAFVNSGIPERYSLVCKVHTKRSPHLSDGERWRRDLVCGILGSSENVSRILHAFASDLRLGLVVANGQIYNRTQCWIANRSRVQALARQVKIDMNRLTPDFAAGSIFWIRGIILKKLRELELKPSSFEREMGALDGTMAHAVERLFSIFTAAGGYKLAEAGKPSDHLEREVFKSFQSDC